MQFVNDLLEYIGLEVLAIRALQVDINVPLAVGVLVLGILVAAKWRVPSQRPRRERIYRWNLHDPLLGDNLHRPFDLYGRIDQLGPTIDRVGDKDDGILRLA